MTSPRLLALDLDGTLLRHDGSVCPEDLVAIDRARDAGIAVTLCTGRILSGTLPTALALRLDTPIICADGALVADPYTGKIIARLDLNAAALTALTEKMQSAGMAPFWCTHDEIHGEHHGEPYAHFVKVWSPSLTLHANLQASPIWSARDKVTMSFGIGTQQAVEDAHEWLQATHAPHVYSVTFPALRASAWTLLARRTGVDKSVGLARVAADLGVSPHEVAVVGDWVNDVPMFRWAGRSFAMGSAPPEVSCHASDVLKATSKTGGGVAEAVGHILRARRHG